LTPYRYSACILAVCGLVCAATLAQAQSSNPKPAPVAPKPAPAPAPVAQRPAPAPAPVQQRPTASQQLQYANQGTAQRNHAFDATKAPPNPVSANPAPKPSMVGVPVSQFKPSPNVTPSKPPPSPTPVGSVQPSKLNPTGNADVQRGINGYKRPGT
jgi:hypothetical protein